MTLPKKGFRKIVVGGEEFRWKVRKKISWNELHNGTLGIPIKNDEIPNFGAANH